jgi:hypothetical protein
LPRSIAAGLQCQAAEGSSIGDVEVCIIKASRLHHKGFILHHQLPLM